MTTNSKFQVCTDEHRKIQVSFRLKWPKARKLETVDRPALCVLYSDAFVPMSQCSHVLWLYVNSSSLLRYSNAALSRLISEVD